MNVTMTEKVGTPMDAVKKSLPMKLLNKIKDTYPSVFDQLDTFRYDETMNDLWPHGQIFVPVAAVTSLFSNSDGIPSVELYQDMEVTAALAGWRQQKNIYSFTEEAVSKAGAMDMDVPVSDLKVLAWSMYIQPHDGTMLPGMNNALDGVFAYWDLDKDVYELRFLPISTQGQQFPPIVLSIPRNGEGTIAQSITKSIEAADDVYAPAMLKTYLTQWTQFVVFLAAHPEAISLDKQHVYKPATKTLRDTPQEIAYYNVKEK